MDPPPKNCIPTKPWFVFITFSFWLRVQAYATNEKVDLLIKSDYDVTWIFPSRLYIMQFHSKPEETCQSCRCSIHSRGRLRPILTWLLASASKWMLEYPVKSGQLSYFVFWKFVFAPRSGNENPGSYFYQFSLALAGNWLRPIPQVITYLTWCFCVYVKSVRCVYAGRKR
jgi:hypothetical protein